MYEFSRREKKKSCFQKAQGMVEYALILAFVIVISVALAISRPELAKEISGVMDHAASLFSSSE